MDKLIAGGEITLGVALFIGLTLLWSWLRPRGTLEAKPVIDFPAAWIAAWIIVGLLLTCGFAGSIALISVGLGVLR